MYRLFELCCACMESLASVFHTSYRTINVILFNDIGNTILLASLINIVLRFFSGTEHARKVLFFLILTLILLVVFLLFLGLRRLLLHPEKIESEIQPDNEEFDDKDRIDIMFKSTAKSLFWLARVFRTRYSVVNIVVYCVLYPLISIAGLIVAWI